ncbi:MAG: cryptochrome/photolyase family protein [Gemmatimonadota bacterium]|nr:cryptochrome/photolyase family protein [Gemmatimonadota bacterium]
MSRPTWFVGPWELSTATAHLPPTPDAGRVLLIESSGRNAALPWHRWKLVLELSALRHFVAELRAAGYEVDHRVAPSYAAGIGAHIAEFGPGVVYAQEAAEWGIGEALRPISPIEILPDRRFLTSRADFQAWAKGRKLLRMEDFYRWQRKRLGVLMEQGQPVGGEWNLDRENRATAKALRKRGLPPAPAGFEPDGITREVMALVTQLGERGTGNGLWGSVEGFDLPVTRAQALEALEDFLDHRLADFGPYEDAMLSGERYLYHSRLSPAMNVGLLHPGEMVEAAVARFRLGSGGEWSLPDGGSGSGACGGQAPPHPTPRPAAGVGRAQLHPTPRPAASPVLRSPFPVLRSPFSVPLSSVEGFVRQVIGWREYVNGIYWLKMPQYREHNYFGFERPLPRLYWEPERTDLACLRDSVRMVRDTAYAHHIHRLMVLSNFATLAGVHPLRLSEWFWAGFADAMEWVELPNVVGMATFGDGGLLASKPYVSSAAYINRMSDYCAGCRYDPARRTGPDACPFNYLYWTFLDDIRRKKLDVGQRMALVLKGLERIPATELAEMRAERKRFLATLEPDETGWSFDHDQG